MNNRHTVKILFHGGPHDDFLVKDSGILRSKYEFSQVHLHWGEDDLQGSEHTIDGKNFPMEIHFVHWNLAEGKTMREAVKENEGTSLEVLAVLLKGGKTNEKPKE